ncbi:MAG: hypothetical protein Phog2KO_33000 [Phototrophicaceae bacterium]
MPTKILDFIDGQWTDAKSVNLLDVINPIEFQYIVYNSFILLRCITLIYYKQFKVQRT